MQNSFSKRKNKQGLVTIKLGIEKSIRQARMKIHTELFYGYRFFEEIDKLSNTIYIKH